MPDQHWPCAQCGADLRFVPGATELKCDHCGHVQPIPARPKARALGEIALSRGLADDLTEAQTQSVQSTPCPNRVCNSKSAGTSRSAVPSQCQVVPPTVLM